MPQPLPSKERSLFQQVVKNYESKQYKKGVKAADQILRKIPDHGDTQAMKALILNAQNQTDEAFKLAKDALKSDMKSHICWHVYGLLYRSAKNFEESMKAYRMALRWEPDSQQIQRDLAMLQIQMRDYPGYVVSRNLMLQARPGWRANWTALAIAQHLNGEFDEAEKTLTTYENTLKMPPPKTDIEHQEAILYKNMVIFESGATERALDHLNEAAARLSDQQTVLELRARYLLKLNRHEEAATVFRQLLERNNEYRAYYEGLEDALQISPGDTEARKALYASYAQKSKRGDAAHRLPLDFLQGAEFREAAESYLRHKLRKGIPSTFSNLKALYVNTAKSQILLDLVKAFLEDDSSQQTFRDAASFFLAQHYDYHLTRNIGEAEKLIDTLLEREPSMVDYMMTKARIRKHQGDFHGAADIMEKARALDEKDRYINTKAAKYQLRDDRNFKALNNMSKFTKPDATGGPLADLIDMQSVWFMTEDGESRLRQGDLALALKRFHTVYAIYEVWQEDQYDFHGFSLRKGQIRAYIDMLRWEDKLRHHPYYTRAAVGAIEAYLQLHDKPDLARGTTVNGNPMDSAELKKASKKLRKEAERQSQIEHEKRDAKKTAGAGSDGELKMPDPDPYGKRLIETQRPLEDAMKFLTPLMEFSMEDVDVQRAGYEVSLRRKRWLPALRCILAAKRRDPADPFIHEASVRLRHSLNNDQNGTTPAVKAVIERLGKDVLPGEGQNLLTYNDKFLSARSKFCDQLAGFQVRVELDKTTADDSVRHLGRAIESDRPPLQDICDGLRRLQKWNIPMAAYTTSARRVWPEAKVFKV